MPYPSRGQRTKSAKGSKSKARANAIRRSTGGKSGGAAIGGAAA